MDLYYTLMKDQFSKYDYLGVIYPEVPLSWEKHILDMLKLVDHRVRPWFLPKWFFNEYCDSDMLISIHNKVYFTQIKQKFGTLRIYGTFSPEIEVIVRRTESLCNNICEECGKSGTENTTIKGWVKNICLECKERLKK